MMKYLDQNNNKRLHWRLGPYASIIIFVANAQDHRGEGVVSSVRGGYGGRTEIR